jgi:hypothetical protein
MNNLLCWKKWVYAPKAIGAQIMASQYDWKVAGHFGRECTGEVIWRKFFKPNMKLHIRRYCNECDNFQRTKCSHHTNHVLVHLLEMICKLWTNVRTDYISYLPKSDGATMTLVVVDHYTKMIHLIPIKKKGSPRMGRPYPEYVCRYHRFSRGIVSDGYGTFTEQFVGNIFHYLGIHKSMSMAFHPQSHGQTDWMNEVIKSYLHSYCNYEPIDWTTMLDMAKYAYHISKHSATKVSVWYANYR